MLVPVSINETNVKTHYYYSIIFLQKRSATEFQTREIFKTNKYDVSFYFMQHNR